MRQGRWILTRLVTVTADNIDPLILLLTIAGCLFLGWQLYLMNEQRKKAAEPRHSDKKAYRHAENVAGRITNALHRNQHSYLFEITGVPDSNFVAVIRIKRRSENVGALVIRVLMDSIRLESAAYNVQNMTVGIGELDKAIAHADYYMTVNSVLHPIRQN